jgi:hypothetical protein
VAKPCINCGQPLLKDDARFCNDCGHSQIPPSASVAASSSIKVKLPPKEFWRDESPSAWQEKDASEPAVTSDKSLSTMVAPGWQEELARLRKGSPSVSSMPPEVSASSSVPSQQIAPQRAPSVSSESERRAEQADSVSKPPSPIARQRVPSAPLAPERKADEVNSVRKPPNLVVARRTPSVPLVPEQVGTVSKAADPVAPQRVPSAPLPSERKADEVSSVSKPPNPVVARHTPSVPLAPEQAGSVSKAADPVAPQRTSNVPLAPEQAGSVSKAADPVAPQRTSNVPLAPEHKGDEASSVSKPPGSRISGRMPSGPSTPESKADEASSVTDAINLSAKTIVPSPHPARRELQVRVWEREETIRYPQIPAEKKEAGPTPAVGKTPLPQPLFDMDEEEIADLDTFLWPVVENPASKKESREQVRETSQDEKARIEEVADIVEIDAKKEDIEDLPTTPVEVPEAAKREPAITIERASTPAPKNWSVAQVELDNVADMPTKPMVVDFISSSLRGPLSPLPPSVPQPVTQTRERPAKFNRSSQRVANPNSLPGGPAPSSGPPPFAQSANATKASSSSTSEGSLRLGPQTPPIPISGQPPSSPLSQPMNTPSPDVGSVSAEVKKPRKKKRVGRVLVALLIVLILLGSGGYVIYLHPLVNFLPSSQPYQNNALGFSLSYPEGWTVKEDQAHGMVHFADNTRTGQVNLAVFASSSQTQDQYLATEAAQMGITGWKAAPSASFGNTTWEEVQGSVTQSGATYTIGLYVTQHQDRFYALACLAPASPASVYAQMEHDDFGPLRASFLFL